MHVYNKSFYPISEVTTVDGYRKLTWSMSVLLCYGMMKDIWQAHVFVVHKVSCGPQMWVLHIKMHFLNARICLCFFPHRKKTWLFNFAISKCLKYNDSRDVTLILSESKRSILTDYCRRPQSPDTKKEKGERLASRSAKTNFSAWLTHTMQGDCLSPEGTLLDADELLAELNFGSIWHRWVIKVPASNGRIFY